LWTRATHCCWHRSQPRSNKITATERNGQAATAPEKDYALAPTLKNWSSVPPRRPDDVSRSSIRRLRTTFSEKNNAKSFTICCRSRIDVHFCFGSDDPRHHSKTQPLIPGPTADCSRVCAILSTTLDDLARAGFPA
jgi:hypothetical protein